MVTSVESSTADLQGVIKSRVVDDRDAGDENSIDAQRKRLGPPSEVAQIAEKPLLFFHDVWVNVKDPLFGDAGREFD